MKKFIVILVLAFVNLFTMNTNAQTKTPELCGYHLGQYLHKDVLEPAVYLGRPGVINITTVDHHAKSLAFSAIDTSGIPYLITNDQANEFIQNIVNDVGMTFNSVEKGNSMIYIAIGDNGVKDDGLWYAIIVNRYYFKSGFLYNLTFNITTVNYISALTNTQ